MDHHALQGRLVAELHHLSCAARRRLAHAQHGQGTVEYVALILLVGLLLGAAVGLAGGTDFQLADAIRKRLTEAMDGVAAKAKEK